MRQYLKKTCVKDGQQIVRYVYMHSRLLAYLQEMSKHNNSYR